MATGVAPPRPAALAFIFVTVMLDILALGIIIPVLPKLVAAFYHGDPAKTAAIYGWFGAAFALMQLLCSPILGALSDRFGRRPIILLSNFGLGVDYLIMAMASSIPVLLLGRVLAGATSASIACANAYIADVTPPEKRAASFGYLGAAFGVGFIIGPALGGFLGHFDPRLPFWTAAALSIANGCYGLLVLPESLPMSQRAHFAWRRINPLAALRPVFAHPNLLGLASVVFLGQLAHMVFPSVFVLYADYRYRWHEGEVGGALALVGICSMAAQAFLVRKTVAYWGERKTILYGLSFGAAGFCWYGLAGTGKLFLIGIPIMALWGLAGPAMQSLMTKKTPPDEQGRLQGALTALMGLAGLIGPLLFTRTFAAFIDGPEAPHLPGAPFLLSGALLAASLALAWRVAED